MVYLANIRSESLLLVQRKEYGSAAAGFLTRCLLKLEFVLSKSYFNSSSAIQTISGFALISFGFVGE